MSSVIEKPKNEMTALLDSYQQYQEVSPGDDVEQQIPPPVGLVRLHLSTKVALSLAFLFALVMGALLSPFHYRGHESAFDVSELPLLGASETDSCEPYFLNEYSRETGQCSGATTSKTLYCNPGDTPQGATCDCWQNTGTKSVGKTFNEVHKYDNNGDMVYGYLCKCKNRGTICKKLKATLKFTCVPDPTKCDSGLKSATVSGVTEFFSIHTYNNPSSSPFDVELGETVGFQVTEGASHVTTVTKTDGFSSSLGLAIGTDVTMFTATAELTYTHETTKETSTETYSESQIYGETTKSISLTIEPGTMKTIWQLGFSVFGQTFFLPHYTITDGDKPSNGDLTGDSIEVTIQFPSA